MEFLSWLHFLGRAICHQIPERSFIIDGIQMPICARDTGIYIGIFSSLFILFLFKKHCANMIPNRFVSLSLLLFIVPMAFDGVSSYLGWRETTNLLRLVTGILFGAVLPMFVLPLINMKKGQQTKDILAPTYRDFLLAIMVATALGVIFYISIMNGYILATFIVSVVVVWFTLIMSAVLKLVGWEHISHFRTISSGGLALFFLTVLSLFFRDF